MEAAWKKVRSNAGLGRTPRPVLPYWVPAHRGQSLEIRGLPFRKTVERAERLSGSRRACWKKRQAAAEAAADSMVSTRREKDE
jgi:hypothetical protein